MRNPGAFLRCAPLVLGLIIASPASLAAQSKAKPWVGTWGTFNLPGGEGNETLILTEDSVEQRLTSEGQMTDGGLSGYKGKLSVSGTTMRWSILFEMNSDRNKGAWTERGQPEESEMDWSVQGDILHLDFWHDAKNRRTLYRNQQAADAVRAAEQAKADAIRKEEEKKAQARQAEQDKAVKAARAAFAASIPASEPKPEYLGVPVYPGAAYEKALSDVFRAQGQAQFAWSTNDASAAVASFYEKAAGVKPQAAGGGSFIFTKAGKNIVTVSILDNKDKKMGPAKTSVLIAVDFNERAFRAGEIAAPQPAAPAPAGQAIAAPQQPPQAAAPAAPAGNPIVGSWTGTWIFNTTTFTYTTYAFNADGSFSFEGSFKDSQSGVGGTLGGAGTYTVDQASGSFTTDGTYVMKCTEGPAQFYPYFTTNQRGVATWSYSFNGPAMTVAQNANGTAINFYRK